MMSLSPDATEAAGIFENSSRSTSECAEGVESSSGAPESHRHRLAQRRQRQADFKAHRHRASNRHIAMILLEAGGVDIETVDVRRDVRELKLAGSLGLNLPAIQGQVVGQLHRGAGDGLAAWIGHFPPHGSGAPHRLAERRQRQQREYETRTDLRILALRKNLSSPPVLLGFFERGFPGSTDRIRAWIAPEPMLPSASIEPVASGMAASAAQGPACQALLIPATLRQ